jgi:hypothetical protein
MSSSCGQPMILSVITTDLAPAAATNASFRQTIRRLRVSLWCLGLLGMLLANLVGFPGQPIRAQWRANVVKEV